MLVFPSKIKKNKLYRNRVFRFETSPTDKKGNIVFVASTDKNDTAQIMKRGLFRRQSIISLFTPMKTRPLNRKMIRQNQMEYYKEMRTATNGAVIFGKMFPNMYNNRNFYYDMSFDLLSVSKVMNYQGPRKVRTLNKIMSDTIEYTMGNLLEQNLTEDVQYLTEAGASAKYKKAYLVFPITKTYDSLISEVRTNLNTDDPLIVFLQSIRRGYMQPDQYKSVPIIIFYSPNTDIVMVVDRSDPDFDRNFMYILTVLERMNNANKGLVSLEDIDSEDDETEDASQKIIDKKEVIKTQVLNKYINKLKINNRPEERSEIESDIVDLIDDKISKVVDDEKTTADIESAIENDRDLKVKIITYADEKKKKDKYLSTYSKALDKELEIVAGVYDKLEDTIDSDNEDLIEPEDFGIEDIDERLKTSTLNDIDSQYNVKQAKKDLINVVTAFSNDERHPLILEDMTITNTSNAFSHKDTISLKYKDPDGRSMNVNIDIPRLIEDRYFYINGNKKLQLKQLFRLPVVKTKADRVELTTNYYKAMIERSSGKLYRTNEYLLKAIKAKNLDKSFVIDLRDNSAVNSKYKNNFEFQELASHIGTIENDDYILIFNRDKTTADLNLLDTNKLSVFLNDDCTPIGYHKNDDGIIYIDDAEDGGVFMLMYNGEKYVKHQIAKSLFQFIYYTVLGKSETDKIPDVGKAYAYSNVKILKKVFPLVTILGITFGLEQAMKMAGIKYKFSQTKLPKKNDAVEIRFENGWLYYEDTIQNGLIMNAVYKMNPEMYPFSAFNTEEPYLNYFAIAMPDTYRAKSFIKNNLDVMIDPITRDVLTDLKLPTDIFELLIYCSNLLSNDNFRPINDIRNFRIRGNEITYALLYHLMANAYVNYKAWKDNGSKNATLDIKKEALISELMKSPNVSDASVLNPMLEMEDLATVSAKGPSGLGINLGAAYTLPFRAYDPNSMTGIFGNATPFGNPGVNRFMSFNPKIDHIRGYVKDIDHDSLNASNMMSPSEMLSAFTSTHADGMRNVVQISQTKHVVPVADNDPLLVTSGVSKTIPYILSSDFTFKAKYDGVVEKIDEAEGLVLLKYDNGTKDAIDISDKIEKNSGGGFFLRMQRVVVYKEGERFKKHDILAYNPEYFTGKGKHVDLKMGTLAKVALASTDTCYEDATMICDTLSTKCATRITLEFPVFLNPRTDILKIVKKGDPIKTGENFIEFVRSYDDPDIDKVLAAWRSKGVSDEDINSREFVSSKYTGKIVDVKVIYNVDETEMSESLQKLVREKRVAVEKKKKLLDGIDYDSVILPITEKQNIEKYKNKEFEGAIILFYVEYNDKLTLGDKICYSTAQNRVVNFFNCGKLLRAQSATT